MLARDLGYLSDGARARVDAERALADAHPRAKGNDNGRGARERETRLLRVRRARANAETENDDGCGGAAMVDGAAMRVIRETRRRLEEAEEALARERDAREREGSERKSVERAMRRAVEEARGEVEEWRRREGGVEAAKRELEATRERAARAESALEATTEDLRRAREFEKRAVESVNALKAELSTVRQSLEVVSAESSRTRAALEAATARRAEDEARAIHAVRSAEALKRELEDAERRASEAERRAFDDERGRVAHSCDLVERAKRDVLDARARADDMERRLGDANRALEEMREHLGPQVERARLEGAQTSKARIEALSREVDSKARRLEELEREGATATARFNELRRGAEFRISSLESRLNDAERRLSESDALVEGLEAERDALRRRAADVEAILERSCSSDVAVTSYLARLEGVVDDLYAKVGVAEKLARARRVRRAAKTGAWRFRALAARRARDVAKHRASGLLRANEESLARSVELETQLAEAARVIDETGTELAQESARREEAERRLDEWMQRADSMRVHVALLEEEHAKHFASSLEQGVQADERMGELSERIEFTKLELAAVREELADARRDVDAAMTREQSLRWKNQELRALNESLRETIEAKMAEMDEHDGVETALAKREEELAVAEARAARLDCELADAKIDARRAREDAMKISIELERLRVERASTSIDAAPEEAALCSVLVEVPATPPSRALALTPDHVRPESEPNDERRSIVISRAEEAPKRPTPTRGNPFARLAATNKENSVAASPKSRGAIERRRPHVDAPLSPLSLLNIR